MRIESMKGRQKTMKRDKRDKRETKLFDIELLRRDCTDNIDKILKRKKYKYIDNDSEILAVAHLDTVLKDKLFLHDKGRKLVFSPALDDRLGYHIITKVFPKLNINVDILLTNDEEKGRSTAYYFEPDKQYNWMVEFDRRGTGCVLYQYDTNISWTQSLKEFFPVHHGSYSDIADLSHCNCSGVNVGTGYYQEHTMGCHAYLEDTELQLRRFKKFYDLYSEVPFPFYDWIQDPFYHDTETKVSWDADWYDRRDWDGKTWSEYYGYPLT